MKSLEEQIEELKAKHAAHLVKTEMAARILTAMPEEFSAYDVRVHVGIGCYGAEATLRVDYDFFRYSANRDKPQPTLETIIRLHDAFPGVPLVKVKGGCLSFRPKEIVNAMPESKKERWDSEEDIAPFRVDVNGFQQLSAEFEWYARIAGLLVHVEVKLPLMPELGRLDMRADRYEGHGPIKRYTLCQFTANREAVYTLFSPEGESLADLQSTIKWASGGPEYPNSFTLFWINHREDKTATVADLARQLIAAKKGAPNGV